MQANMAAAGLQDRHVALSRMALANMCCGLLGVQTAGGVRLHGITAYEERGQPLNLDAQGRLPVRDLLPGPILPPVIDKELLVEAEKELGQSLRPYQEAREWLRDAFWARVHREFGIVIGRSRG